MNHLNTCFQCGKKTIVVKKYEEVVNGSVVKVTESICSDPECQKKTEKILEKEKARRDEAIYSKSKLAEKTPRRANLNLSKTK